jgi:hypothetical protein
MAIFALMMEAVGTSEMSVIFFHTAFQQHSRNSHPHTLGHENLKSHPYVGLFMNYAADKTSLNIPKVFYVG